MITGYLDFKGIECIFWLEEDILTVNAGSGKQLVTVLKGIDDEDTKETEDLTGNISESGNKILFIVKMRKMRTIGRVDIYQFVIHSYFEFTTDTLKVDSLSIFTEELNWFYNIEKAYVYMLDQSTNELNFKLKGSNSTLDKISFKYEDKPVSISFGISRSLSTRSTVPLKLSSVMTLSIESTSDYNYLLGLYYVASDFLKLITYRRNITVSRVILKNINEVNGKYSVVGSLNVFEEKNYFVESEKTIQRRIIGVEILKNNCSNLFQLLADKNIYMQHIPHNTRDMNSINPARFVLITAAFEWEFKCLYGNWKTENNLQFSFIKAQIGDHISELIDHNTGQKKKYARASNRLINNYDMNLSGRIEKAIMDFQEVLSPFIINLYGINGIKDFKYRDMAQRLEAQRNNYAHGNIEKEINSLVILDLLVLEWVIYVIILHRSGLDQIGIRDAINNLFERHLRFV